jgi:hypothetical protein
MLAKSIEDVLAPDALVVKALNGDDEAAEELQRAAGSTLASVNRVQVEITRAATVNRIEDLLTGAVVAP